MSFGRKEHDYNHILLAMSICSVHRTALHSVGYTVKHDDLEQATNFLHENRLLFHFDDRGLLSDFYFIDPEWLCSTLAKVITVQQKLPLHEKGTVY